jgi:ribosomal protein L29
MLDLDLIRTDGGTQSRVELNQETVAEYAEAYKGGAEFPPVTVFYDGVDRWLADGFHRYFGAKAAGRTTILENVTPGTQRDAIRYSLGANDAHGVRRSNADKRKAVLVALNDAEWSALPHKEIAGICNVSREYVSRLASEIESSCDRSQDTKRTVTRNGKTYEQDTSKIGKAKTAAAPAPAPAVQPKAKDEPAANDAREDEFAESAFVISELAEENETLRAQIAVGQMDAPEVERISAAELIADLRAQVKTLEAELAAMRVSRDRFQSENRELMKQVGMNARELKKLRAA